MPRTKNTPTQNTGASEFIVRVRHESGNTRVTTFADMTLAQFCEKVAAELAVPVETVALFRDQGGKDNLGRTGTVAALALNHGDQIFLRRQSAAATSGASASGSEDEGAGAGAGGGAGGGVGAPVASIGEKRAVPVEFGAGVDIQEPAGKRRAAAVFKSEGKHADEIARQFLTPDERLANMGFKVGDSVFLRDTGLRRDIQESASPARCLCPPRSLPQQHNRLPDTD
jgi:hypothetical protein